MGKINLILHLRSGDSTSAFRYFVNYLRTKVKFIEIRTVKEMSMIDDEEINTIFIPYNFGLLDNIIEKAKFIQKHTEAKIVRFLNEYNLCENGSLQKIFQERPVDLLITNYEREKTKRYYKNRLMLNCNCLSYFDFNTDFSMIKKYDIPLYYGTFRLGRLNYLRKYIHDNDYIFLSISKKNLRKLKKYQINAKKIIDKIKNIGYKNSTLVFFKHSLYIEDEFTHQNYNYPANRFYECLSYDVVQFFDSSCKNTFDRYGLDVSKFMVNSKEELKERCQKGNYLELLKGQRQWRDLVKRDFIEFEKIVEEKILPYF